jgi:hypothetical protein
MRTEQTEIRALEPHEWAIGVAKLAYQNWQAKVPPEKRIKFEDELMDYLCSGFVVSRPTIFAMMKIIDVAEEGAAERKLAWFVRVAVGDLRELTGIFAVPLPYMALYRHGDSKMRVYPFHRTIALMMRFGGITVDKAIARLLRGEIRCIKNNAD